MGRRAPKRPDRARAEQVPVVLGLEEPAQLPFVPVEVNLAVLELLGQAVVERLGDERETVALIGSLGRRETRDVPY